MNPNYLLSKSIGLFLCIFFLFCYSTLRSQNSSHTVTGRISDENGKGIEGITITVKGTNNRAVSTENGSYKISNVTGKETLVFTSVEYQPQEVSVNNRSVIDLSLGVSEKILNDVVVIGYGTQKKANVTGAVSTLRNTNLDERVITRVDQALVGQLAGVTVKQTTGVPGKAFSVQVRGSGSISG